MVISIPQTFPTQHSPSKKIDNTFEIKKIYHIICDMICQEGRYVDMFGQFLQHNFLSISFSPTYKDKNLHLIKTLQLFRICCKMWKIPESPQCAHHTNRLASDLSCNCHHAVQPRASQTTQKTVCKVAKWYSSQN